MALRFPRTLTIAGLVENLKTSSSKWLKAQSAELAGFSWQRGYGLFSVGPSDLDALRAYIDGQEEHVLLKLAERGIAQQAVREMLLVGELILKSNATGLTMDDERLKWSGGETILKRCSPHE